MAHLGLGSFLLDDPFTCICELTDAQRPMKHLQRLLQVSVLPSSFPQLSLSPEKKDEWMLREDGMFSLTCSSLTYMLSTPSGSVSQPVLHMTGSTLLQLMKLLKQWMDAPTAQTQSTGPGQG